MTQGSNNLTLPKLVYYNDNPPESHRCTSKISSELEIYWSTPGTWSQLVTEIADGNRYIAFNASMIAKSMHTTAVGFIDAIKIITRFLPDCKELAFGVVITPSTPATVIRDFQKAGVQGILLDIDYYSVEEVKTSINALMNNIPYWPKHIISQLPDTSSRLLSVYFRPDWYNYKPTFDFKKFKSMLEVDVAYCTGWEELDKTLGRNPYQLIFHVDLMKRLDLSVHEIMSMLETRMKLAGVSMLIGVAIDNDTPAAVIKELKKAGVFGIVPGVGHFGIDECVAGIHALRDRIPYWPDHIINRLPHPQKSLPTVVSFWAKPCVTLSNDIKQQVLDKNLYRVNFCDSWDRLTACAGNSADLILFHSDMIGTQGLSAAEVVNMISTLVHYTSGPPPKIGAVVDKDTPIEVIKELRKTNICGLVPNSTYWGVDVGTSSVVSLLKNEAAWPMQHLFSNQAQIDEVMSITPPVKIANIPLTTRQQEIADLIKYRGISNKHIARQLGIGESAVKLHVGAILKKHNLRNRTQLAVALSQGLKA